MSCVRGPRLPASGDARDISKFLCGCTRVTGFRDITVDLQARLDLIDRLRRNEDERHREALQALDQQLRDENERHRNTVEAIERDREALTALLEVEPQFLTESRVKDYERRLLRAGEEAAAALPTEEDSSGEGAVALLRQRRREA